MSDEKKSTVQEPEKVVGLRVGEECEVCYKFVEGFLYEGCCSGIECGCMGMPIEPCICSKKCWDKFKAN